MHEWVELFDELRPEVSPWPFGCFGVAGLEEKIYVHSEVEVHTVYQRLFKKLHGKGLHALHATLILYAFTLLALYTGYKLEGF